MEVRRRQAARSARPALCSSLAIWRPAETGSSAWTSRPPVGITVDTAEHRYAGHSIGMFRRRTRRKVSRTRQTPLPPGEARVGDIYTTGRPVRAAYGRLDDHMRRDDYCRPSNAFRIVCLGRPASPICSSAVAAVLHFYGLDRGI